MLAWDRLASLHVAYNYFFVLFRKSTTDEVDIYFFSISIIKPKPNKKNVKTIVQKSFQQLLDVFELNQNLTFERIMKKYIGLIKCNIF